MEGVVDVTPDSPPPSTGEGGDSPSLHISLEISAAYRDEVIKHLDGYKNVFELRNGYKKHFHEWEEHLTPEDMAKVQTHKDAIKKRFEEKA